MSKQTEIKVSSCKKSGMNQPIRLRNDDFTAKNIEFAENAFQTKGKLSKVKENAYTENAQISVYTQDFTVGPQVFNGQSACTMHSYLWLHSKIMGTQPIDIQGVTVSY